MPSYEVVCFLDWLRKQQNDLAKVAKNNDMMEEYAAKYLKAIKEKSVVNHAEVRWTGDASAPDWDNSAVSINDLSVDHRVAWLTTAAREAVLSGLITVDTPSDPVESEAIAEALISGLEIEELLQRKQQLRRASGPVNELLIRAPIGADVRLAAQFIGHLMTKSPFLPHGERLTLKFFHREAMAFCISRNIKDSRQFAGTVANWLARGGQPGTFGKLWSLLSRSPGFQYSLPNHLREPSNFFSFLMTKRFNAFLAFPSDSRFEDFMRQYGKDVHETTGEHMNVFYSPEQVRDGQAGGALRTRLQHADQDADVPAMIIWYDDIEVAQAINLVGLEPLEICNLFNRVVARIIACNGLTTLHEIYAVGKKAAEDFKAMKSGSKITNYFDNRKATIGIQGNVKDQATVVQALGASPSVLTLSNSDAKSLEQLADLVVTAKGINVNKATLHAAAAKLAYMAQEAENPQGLEAAEIEWKKWIKTLGESGVALLAFISSVVTVSGEQGIIALSVAAMKLLGLQ
ncbi:hypothetical protein [Azospirillum argentinense]